MTRKGGTILWIILSILGLMTAGYISKSELKYSTEIATVLFASIIVGSNAIYAYGMIHIMNNINHKLGIIFLYGLGWSVMIAIAWNIKVPFEISSPYISYPLVFTATFIANHIALSGEMIRNLSNAIDYFFSNEELTETSLKTKLCKYFCKKN